MNHNAPVPIIASWLIRVPLPFLTKKVSLPPSVGAASSVAIIVFVKSGDHLSLPFYGYAGILCLYPCCAAGHPYLYLSRSFRPNHFFFASLVSRIARTQPLNRNSPRRSRAPSRHERKIGLRIMAQKPAPSRLTKSAVRENANPDSTHSSVRHGSASHLELHGRPVGFRIPASHWDLNERSPRCAVSQTSTQNIPLD